MILLQLTNESTYNIQHCCPGIMHNDSKSIDRLVLYNSDSRCPKYCPKSYPSRPWNLGEASAELVN